MLTRRILVLIAFSSAMLDAQNITGSIVGQVTDASGSAVPAAAITVKNMDTGLTAQTITDTSGSYSLPNLLAGTYEITVRKTGFQTTSVSRLALLSTQTLRQDVSLQVGAVQESADVAPSGTIADTRDGGLPNPNSARSSAAAGTA